MLSRSYREKSKSIKTKRVYSSQSAHLLEFRIKQPIRGKYIYPGTWNTISSFGSAAHRLNYTRHTVLFYKCLLLINTYMIFAFYLCVFR